ncbi:PAS domain S-box protein [Methylomonas sp. LL1]|uniref:PAS domain S-box protein n=1 Tax=Methylomonas sp. LL1 TaxID=2785785 RepID=UPI0018C382AA|nr:PAS domain S-box protein [Methylomonas sp. LL1]QPK63622.1 PAS domain S-box protein [Methylomonas sp. LL1]
MLQKRLIILLSLLILLPTLVIGWMAYHFSIEAIGDDRVKVVGRIAENRHQQLKQALQRSNSRAHNFLADISRKCLNAGNLDRDCAGGLLADYLHIEAASGVALFGPDSDAVLSVGEPAVGERVLAEFGPEQLAGITDPNPQGRRFYYVIAGDKQSALQLRVAYPLDLIQPIFTPPADLGQSGEIFLADRNGFFITTALYAAAQGHSHPISARPMRDCLSRLNTEMLEPDYRGVAVIHGFRYVPEIGGGCIMAHIDQAEAFAPVRALEKRIVIAVLLFIVLTSAIAKLLARRIVRPILRLTEAARRISDGDHSIRAEVKGLDEISELAKSFNQMTDALADARRDLEAKVAERTQALRTSQERYMLAERCVNDGIWDWNIVTHEYYLSPRWNTILGYADGELPNEESIFFKLIHPEDKARASEVFRRHLENMERYCAEIRLRHKDGSYRWVLDRGEALRDQNGKPVRMIGSITDITERKAAEAQLIEYREHLEQLVAMATTEVQAIVKTAVNGVISIDATGAIRVFNPAAESLFGWKAEEVIGKNVSLLMPEPFAGEHDGHIQRFLQTNQSTILGIEREVVAQRKDGSVFPANLAVGHGIISEGRHIFVGFIADISSQKQVEQELRLAKEAAEAAAKAKANFLANMSHEIRTPMNTIIGFAEVALQNKALSPDTREHVRTILGSGKHLLNVINDILDFSKIEAGKVELESVCFNLHFAVQETLQTIGLRAAEKGLKIELRIAPDLPRFFSGDPNRLRQVILNLVGNAVKFTESGVISVLIEQAEGEDMLHFAISDTGIGMTVEQADRIFDSFSQADTTTSRRFGGTGLGTTISKQIVEMMGGRIWVESALGRGSTFHFTIRLPSTMAQDSCLYLESPQLVMDYFSPRCFKVLLAEDIEANATLARLRLEQQGHSVVWVKNGREAVDAFSQGGFDLILMDLQMPVLDGINATKQIRQLEHAGGGRIPILALTASVLKHEKILCTEAGMDAIIGKPIDVNELLEQMELLTPKGVGQPRTAIKLESTPQIPIDFSPLSSVADTGKGLQTWREALVYAHALIRFAEEHGNDAARMAALFAENPNNLGIIERLAHALKGVAGNLALIEVARLAVKLDDRLKQEQLENIAAEFSALDTALKASVAAIRQLQLPEKQPILARQAIDTERVAGLLRQLLVALDGLNPDRVEPIVQQLEPYLDQGELKTIQHEVDNFDFDAAKAEVQKLVKRFGSD